MAYAISLEHHFQFNLNVSLGYAYKWTMHEQTVETIEMEVLISLQLE